MLNCYVMAILKHEEGGGDMTKQQYIYGGGGMPTYDGL